MSKKIRAHHSLFFLGLLAVGFCRSPDSYTSMGFAYLNQGKPSHALYFFNKALQQQSDHSLALYGKGILLSENPITYPLAKSCLEKALAKELGEKERLLAYEKLILMALREGKAQEALEFYRKAMEQKVSSPNFFLLAAKIPPSENFHPLMALEKGLQLYPAEAELHLQYVEVSGFYKSPQLKARYLQQLYEGGVKNEKILLRAAYYYYISNNKEKAWELLLREGTKFSPYVKLLEEGLFSPP
ncbi:MAG: hypothetical protein NZM25_03710 [Leptospiraceae bacterium]|nr:hypothetical protein [Leptospiraceae bacterium]MDW8306091.1 hypothetical protein [Leptospiraceae bacterium]